MKKNHGQTAKSGNSLLDVQDLLFLWRLLLKNLIIIIVLPLLAYSIGYVYAYRLPSIYGAQAEVLFKSNETYDYQDPIYKGLGAYGMYMDVQNQIRILTSNDLISEVIDKSNLQTSYYFVGRLKRKEVFRTLPFEADVIVVNPQIYEVPIRVKILKEEYKIDYDLNGRVNSQSQFFGEDLITEDFILKLSRRYQYRDKNLKSITTPEYEIHFHSKDYLINKYRASLEVENIEYTSILSVQVTDELQQRAKVFLDTLLYTYRDYSKNEQLEINQNTLQNIEKQIDTVRNYILKKEEELLYFKDKNSILNIERQESDYFSNYVNYSRDKRELEHQLSSVNLLYEYLKSSDDIRILPPFFYIEKNDEYLASAVADIRELQIDIELKSTNVTEDNLVIRNLKKEIAIKKKDISAYLDNLQAAIQRQINSLDGEITAYKNRIQTLPKSAQGVLTIQRELDVNNRMYLFLLEKKTNTLIARAGIIPQVKIIEETSRSGVVSPDKTKIRRLFVLGGMLIALLIGVLRKIFFEKIENVQMLSEITEYPIAGGVPFLKGISYELVTDSKPKSHVTESFRTIRTNLSFMGVNSKECKKVLVSSFFPGEGKTFCSTNISTLIAKGEKKVLLIDFDLHRPKVHKVFQLSNNVGVSSYVIGRSDINEIIHSNVKPGLDVVTAGPIAPNPSELILGPKIDEMLAKLENKYDFVILDTPPFGLLNDTLELLKKCDIFLVVLRAQFINRRGVDHIESLISQYSEVSVGFILNGIKQSKIQYYYSKYTYSYGYGYGYGYNYGSGYGGNYYGES